MPEPTLRRAAPDGLGGRAIVRHALFRTLPGRALVLGALVRLAAFLLTRIVGPTPIVDVAGTAGTLAVLVGVVYFVVRGLASARRRLLWRVRRKLILSYIFVGLVPALLIVVFFVLCGLLLFSSIASYVVQTRLRSAADQAQFLGRTVAIELAQVQTAADAGALVERKQAAIASRYPLASLAVVPVERSCPGESGRARSRPVPLAMPLVAGPWPHLAPPTALPAWVPCAGFAGLVAFRAGGTTDVAVRAAALPDGPSPRFAVVLDFVLTDAFVRQMRTETGIAIRELSVIGGTPPTGAAAPVAPLRPPTTAEGATGFGRSWVVFLDHTDWATGQPGTAALSIGMSIGEVYERLSPSRAGRMSFSQVLMLIIVVVGALFLLIQFVALVMGLALARSITGSVHELFVGTERVQQGDFAHRIQVRARDQLGELADSFNTMTGRLSALLAEMAEKKRLEEELRIARQIQMSLLPQGPLRLPGLVVTAHCSPAREVGGDYYDFLPLGGRRVGLLVADVSGKGTSAALYMAELKGLMLSLSQIHRSPRELLIALDRIIADNLDSRSFITMTYAVVDLDAGTMTCARAGHTPILHVPGPVGARGVPRFLTPDGMVLGLKLDHGEKFQAILEELTVPLGPGDLFALYTDGLTEATNASDELFGEDRLGQLIADHADAPFDELRERILRDVRAFAGDPGPHDDMTLILFKVEDAGR